MGATSRLSRHSQTPAAGGDTTRACAATTCSLHASRCSLAAVPSPPLEKKGKERRSSFSTSTPERLVPQPAGMSPRTAASRMVRGVLPPPPPPPPEEGGNEPP